MLKSLLVMLAVFAGIAFTNTANAQRTGDTQTLTVGCNASGCTYAIYRYQPGGPNGGWQLVGYVFVRGQDPSTIER